MGQQLKMHLKVCVGFPKGDIPSSSDKEPAPQSAQESSQDSSCCSQHPKKKLDSAKEFSSHSKVHKSHKKSKHLKEGTPKKEKWDKDKADKHKPEKSHKKLHHPCTSAVHHLRVMHARSGVDNLQELLFLVVAFNHLSPLSIFHYSCIFL